MIEPVTKDLRDLFHAMQALDWTDEGSSLETVARLLADTDAVTRAVCDERNEWGRGGLGLRSLVSRETPTHWKWFLGGGSARGPTAWIHEYKPSARRRAGYADSIHDHRYSFVSAILSGGYLHRFYAVEQGRVRQERDVPLCRGDVYVIDADEVHSVADLQEDTLTAIIQAPKRRSFSTEFGPDGLARARHFDFDARAADPGAWLRLHGP